MKAVGFILFIALTGEVYSGLIKTELSFIKGVQLSPRLVYHKKEGDFKGTDDAVAWARELLYKLDLDHLRYKLRQAVFYDKNKLLIEMENYLVAIEVVNRWNKRIQEYDEYPEDNCSKTCVSEDFELTQTELCFFDEKEEKTTQSPLTFRSA